ncbi:MAG: helix-turn-helix domain-containing protein [archaeon]|jgi:predicted transcriptional regulator
MVSLKCKQMDSKELIQCTFGLTKTELKIFLFLLKNKRSVSGNDIAQEIGLDRTTVQKSMKGLLDRDIVLRKQLNLDSGGYLFLYCVKHKDELKTQMQNIIHNWTVNVESQLDKVFEEEK